LLDGAARLSRRADMNMLLSFKAEISLKTRHSGAKYLAGALLVDGDPSCGRLVQFNLSVHPLDLRCLLVEAGRERFNLFFLLRNCRSEVCDFGSPGDQSRGP
jgi:hypothetical protein